MREAGEIIEQTLPNGQVIRFMLGDINGDGHLDQDDVEILTALSGDSYYLRIPDEPDDGRGNDAARTDKKC